MEFLVMLTVVSISIVLFHFLGYPLVLFAECLVCRRALERTDELPSVTLIISAYNEADVIEDKIRNSLELDYPSDKLEILVVADGSDDQTPERVRKYAPFGVRLLHHPSRRGKSAAVNRGYRHSSGEILLFSDANAFYRQDVVKKIVRNFGDYRTGGVSGCKTVRPTDAMVTKSEGLYWRYESAIKSMETCVDSTVGVVGEMIAMRRNLFSRIPANVINDDAYLLLAVLRRGQRVIYEPEAVCWEYASQTMSEEVIRRKRINAGRFYFLFRPSLWPWNQPRALFHFLSHKMLRLLLPVFMIAALLANGIVLMLPGFPEALLWLFLAQATFYCLALAGWVAETSGYRWRLPALAFYITRSSLTSLEGFAGYVLGRQTPVWQKARGAA